MPFGPYDNDIRSQYDEAHQEELYAPESAGSILGSVFKQTLNLAIGMVAFPIITSVAGTAQRYVGGTILRGLKAVTKGTALGAKFQAAAQLQRVNAAAGKVTERLGATLLEVTGVRKVTEKLGAALGNPIAAYERWRKAQASAAPFQRLGSFFAGKDVGTRILGKAGHWLKNYASMYPAFWVGEKIMGMVGFGTQESSEESPPWYNIPAQAIDFGKSAVLSAPSFAIWGGGFSFATSLLSGSSSLTTRLVKRMSGTRFMRKVKENAERGLAFVNDLTRNVTALSEGMDYWLEYRNELRGRIPTIQRVQSELSLFRAGWSKGVRVPRRIRSLTPAEMALQDMEHFKARLSKGMKNAFDLETDQGRLKFLEDLDKQRRWQIFRETNKNESFLERALGLERARIEGEELKKFIGNIDLQRGQEMTHGKGVYRLSSKYAGQLVDINRFRPRNILASVFRAIGNIRVSGKWKPPDLGMFRTWAQILHPRGIGLWQPGENLRLGYPFNLEEIYGDTLTEKIKLDGTAMRRLKAKAFSGIYEVQPGEAVAMKGKKLYRVKPGGTTVEISTPLAYHFIADGRGTLIDKAASVYYNDVRNLAYEHIPADQGHLKSIHRIALERKWATLNGTQLKYLDRRKSLKGKILKVARFAEVGGGHGGISIMRRAINWVDKFFNPRSKLRMFSKGGTLESLYKKDSRLNAYERFGRPKNPEELYEILKRTGRYLDDISYPAIRQILKDKQALRSLGIGVNIADPHEVVRYLNEKVPNISRPTEIQRIIERIESEMAISKKMGGKLFDKRLRGFLQKPVRKRMGWDLTNLELLQKFMIEHKILEKVARGEDRKIDKEALSAIIRKVARPKAREAIENLTVSSAFQNALNRISRGNNKFETIEELFNVSGGFKLGEGVGAGSMPELAEAIAPIFEGIVIPNTRVFRNIARKGILKEFPDYSSVKLPEWEKIDLMGGTRDIIVPTVDSVFQWRKNILKGLQTMASDAGKSDEEAAAAADILTNKWRPWRLIFPKIEKKGAPEGSGGIGVHPLTIPAAMTYSLFNKLNRLGEFFGLGVNPATTRNLQQLLFNKIFLKRYLLGGGIVAGLSYLDYQIDDGLLSPLFENTALDEGLFVAGAEQYVKAKLAVKYLQDKVGMVSAAQYLEGLFPGMVNSPMSRVVQAVGPPLLGAYAGTAMGGPVVGGIGALAGVAISGVTSGFGMWDMTKSYEEERDIYAGRREVAIRKGRWWEMGRCVPPHTIILRGNGDVVKAEDIAVGDKLLTHTGELKRCKRVFVREMDEGEKVYRFTIATIEGLPFEVTEEHPLLAVKGSIQTDPEWIPARYIAEGDYLVMDLPDLSGGEDISYLDYLRDISDHDDCSEGRIINILSPELSIINTIRSILLSYGIVSHIISHNAGEFNGWRIYIGGEDVKRFNDIIVGNIPSDSFSDAPVSPGEYFIYNGRLYTQVKKKEISDYKGKVIDFEVEDDHTFCTIGVVLHNSPYQGCLTPDSEIWVNGEYKRIDRVKKGDIVINRYGKKVRVLDIKTRHVENEKVYGIVPSHDRTEKIWLTGNHPVLCVRLKPSHDYEWIPAEELTDEDFLVYPKYSEISGDDIVGAIDRIETREYTGLVYDIMVEEGESFIGRGMVCHNSRVSYFRPGWFSRLKSQYKFTPTLYGSKSEAWSHIPHNWWGGLGTVADLIINPIDFWNNRTYWQRKHYYSRPYPITQTEFQNVPILGNILAGPAERMHVAELEAIYSQPPVAAGDMIGGPKSMSADFPSVPINPYMGGRMRYPSPRSPGDLSYRIGEAWYRGITEPWGLHGFAIASLKEAITGTPDLFDKMPVLENAARMTSTERAYWDKNLGGMMGCLTPDMRVLTGRGYVKVTDLVPEKDYVLSSDGKLHELLNLIPREMDNKEHVISVKMMGMRHRLKLTEDHKVLVYRKCSLRLEWLPIKDVQEGNYLVFPVPEYKERFVPDSGGISIYDGFVLHKVTDKTIDSYKGTVYDLSVKDVHDFVVEGVIAHNSTELWRRYFPHQRRQIERVNEIPNLMPSWLPGEESYFVGYRTGDPFVKIQEGELRVPGAAYEALHDVKITFPLSASKLGMSYGDMVKYMLGMSTPAEVEEEMHMKRGTRLHEQIQGMLARQNILEKAEAKVYDPYSDVSGSVDAILRRGNLRTALEIKTTTSDKFNALHSPKPNHMVQLNFYLYATGIRHGMLLYVNADDPSQTKTFDVAFDPARLKRDFAKLRRARDHATKLLHQGIGRTVVGYSRVDRLRVIGDLAPFSQDYKEELAKVRAQMRAGLLTEKEIADVKETVRQTRIQKLRYEMHPYRFLKNEPPAAPAEWNRYQKNKSDYNVVERTLGAGWEFVTHLPTPLHSKLLNMRSPIEQYRRTQLYGRECVTGDVLIVTTNGHKHASDIEVGDEVLTRSGEYKRVVAVDPKHISQTTAKDKICLIYVDNIKYPIKITYNHPILVKDISSPDGCAWKDAGKITLEDEIAYVSSSIDGIIWLPVKRVGMEKFDGIVYDFEVEDEHSFTVYGCVVHNSAFWNKPFQDFIQPYVHSFLGSDSPVTGAVRGAEAGFLLGGPTGAMIGGVTGTLWGTGHAAFQNVTGIAYIPGYRKGEREIYQYFDRLKYIKNKRLYELTGEEKYRKAYEGTMAGVNMYGNNWSAIYRALPTRERDFFGYFLKAPASERDEIRRLVPDDVRRILEVKWKQQSDTLKRGNLDYDAAESLTDYFQRHHLPEESWIGWHPSIPLEDIEVKTFDRAGYDAHDVGLGWYSTRTRMRYSPLTPGAMRIDDVTGERIAPNLLPDREPEFSTVVNLSHIRVLVERELHMAGLSNIRVGISSLPMGGNGADVYLKVEKNRVEEIAGYLERHVPMLGRY